MKTRDALRGLTRGRIDAPEVAGPLLEVGERLVRGMEQREAARMERVAQRAPGGGAAFAALKARVAAAGAAALNDSSLPAIMRFDLAQALRQASEAESADRGLRHAAMLARDLWFKEPTGVASVGEVHELREHCLSRQRNSKVGSAVEAALTRRGFSTLPAARLGRIASKLVGADESAVAAAFQAHGLAGDAPAQLRAQAFVRALAGLPAMTLSEPGDVVSRLARRMGQSEDVGAGIPEDGAEETGVEIGEGEEGAAEDPFDSSSDDDVDEGAETGAEVDSPNTGQPMSVSLETQDVSDVPGEGEGATSLAGADAGGLPDMETFDIVGQLEDFAGAADSEIEGPMDPADADGAADAADADANAAEMNDTSIMSGQNSVIVPDPTTDGEQDVRITVEPVEPQMVDAGPGAGAPGAGALPMGPPDLPGGGFAGEGEAMAAQGAGGEPKMAFVVWAYEGGRRGSVPLERFHARSMGHALKHIAGFGVKGTVACNMRAPEREAVVDLGAGVLLHVAAVSGATDRKFKPKINTQQPDQMNVPSGGSLFTTEKGMTSSRSSTVPGISKTETPTSEQSESGERSESEGDGDGVEGSGSEWQKPWEKKDGGVRLARREVESRCAAMGLKAGEVEHKLLSNLRVEAGAWAMYVDDTDEIVLMRADRKTAGKGAARFSLVDVDRAVDEFMVHVAASYVAPGKKEGDAALKWWKSGAPYREPGDRSVPGQPGAKAWSPSEKEEMAYHKKMNDAMERGETIEADPELNRMLNNPKKVGPWDKTQYQMKMDDAMARGETIQSDPGLTPELAQSVWNGKGASVTVRAMFEHRCAMCGVSSEYVMPEGMVSIACGSCGREADASAVERAFARGAARETGDYLITVGVPGREEREQALNARRLLAAVQSVVGGANGHRDSGGALQIFAPGVDGAALARVERLLTTKFGARVRAQAVTGGEQQPMQQTPPGSPMPPELSLTPGGGPPGASVGMGGASMGQSPVGVGSPAAGQPTDPTQAVGLPPASRPMGASRRVGQGLPAGPPKGIGGLGGGGGGGGGGPGGPPGGGAGGGGAPGAPGGGAAGALPTGPENVPAPPPTEGAEGSAQGIGLSPKQEEAIRGAMSLYRTQFLGPATAIAKFLGEYGAILDVFGDIKTPARHKAEASLLRIMGDAYAEPAMAVAASKETRDRQVRRILLAAFDGKCAKCGKAVVGEMTKCADCGETKVAWEKPKVNTQQPDAVRVPKQPLGEDTSGNAAFKNVTVKVQHGSPPGGHSSPGKMKGNGQGEVGFGEARPKATHDPFANAGTKAPKTEGFPGPDSGTGESELGRHMEEVSNAAPDAMRSK